MNRTFVAVSFCLSWTTCLAAAVFTLNHAQANASIRGQVYDSRFGLPVSDAKVTILVEGGVQQKSASDQEGYYEIKNLAAGRYTVLVESLGFARTERTAQVRMGEHILLDIPLRIGHLHDAIPIEINGTIRLLDNTPAKGASIFVLSPFDQQIVATTRVNQDGRYNVRVDDPGQYVIYALKSGFKVVAVPVILQSSLPRGGYTVDIALSTLNLK